MTDYPEKLGRDVAASPPTEIEDYIRLIAGDAKLIRSLDEETEAYGKTFHDPVHKSIRVHPLLVMCIDTPEFQRLRELKSLGCTDRVYPGATHTRFEHSIGVSHLAGLLVKTLASRQPKLDISRSDTLCVMIAGLFHDIGHGPFSHMWEKFMNAKIFNRKIHWEHEDMSLKLFHHLLQSNDLLPVCKLFGLQEQDIVFIGELILGKETAGGGGDKLSRPRSKSFLYDIVANKRTGVDVDKWDYLARDSRAVNVTDGFDCQRFIDFSRVLTDEDGTTQIGFRDKETAALYDMFHTRFKMHKKVYQHHVVKVLDAMTCEAITKADQHIFVRGENGVQYRPSEADKDITAYMKLTDHILEDIYNSSAPELKPARDIVHRIKTRKLYQLIARTQPSTTFGTSEEDLQSQIIATLQTFQEAPLTATKLADNLLIIKTCFNYGKGAQNPMENVALFKKDQPDVARRISRRELSHLLPAYFEEYEVLICYRSDDQEELKKARRVVETWAERKNLALNPASLRMSTFKRKIMDESDSDSDGHGNGGPRGQTARRQLLFSDVKRN